MTDMPPKTIPFGADAIEVSADVIAAGLNIPPQNIHSLMRSGELTSLCEKGEGSDAGRFRLTFFLKSRRFQLIVGEDGAILRRSTVDFGDRPLPNALRRPGV